MVAKSRVNRVCLISVVTGTGCRKQTGIIVNFIAEMQDEILIQNKKQVLDCAAAFRKDATVLMQQLAMQYSFSLEDCGTWPLAVYHTRHDQRGKLGTEWTFYLHGAHCRFENSRTGQIVEVLYTAKPEFGYFSCYFLFQYMQTTARFNPLANRFEEYAALNEILDLLVAESALQIKKGEGYYLVNV